MKRQTRRAMIISAGVATVAGLASARPASAAPVPPPIGSIIAFGGPSTQIPAGWALCNGVAHNRTDPTWTALFNAIGSSWGGDGVNSFNLPDLQGLFLRGVTGPTGNDPDAAQRQAIMPGGHSGNDVGTFQNYETASHAHAVNDPGHAHILYWDPNKNAGTGTFDRGSGNPNSSPNPTTSAAKTGITVDPVGGSESRPRNAAVHFIIRYQ